MADVLTFSEAHTTSRGQHSNERLTHSSVKGTELEILRGTWDRQGKKFSLSAAFTARHTAFRWPSGVLCSAVRSNLDFGTIPVPSTLPPCAGRRLASAPWYFFPHADRNNYKCMSCCELPCQSHPRHQEVPQPTRCLFCLVTLLFLARKHRPWVANG